MKSFEYEWYTVKVRYGTGIYTNEYKAKSKESVIARINKQVENSNSEKNLSRAYWDVKRIQPILEVLWETLTLDRSGYQRL